MSYGKICCQIIVKANKYLINFQNSIEYYNQYDIMIIMKNDCKQSKLGERFVEEKYIISDVSKMLGIEPHVLRYWEDEMALKIQRNQLGHRFYSSKDLEILKRIQELKEQGLQLRAIKILLSKQQRMQENELEMQERHEKQEKEEKQEYPVSLDTTQNKLKQFETFLKSVYETSLEENNKVLKESISEEICGQVERMLLINEEKEERRYRKLDETIREIQKGRQEAAATENKKRGWSLLKRKDKSVY